MAINIENDAGEYESADTIPISGYELSSDSYCNVNGEIDASIKLSYESGSVSINDISKRAKCYLYFDKGVSTAIGNLKVKGEYTEFTGIATEEDTGIYSAPDDYGTSYYFRGLEGSLNNWVKFADSYWRIIRVNGNGTVRMIYSGPANGNVSSSNKTGTTTQINGAIYMYNHTYDDNAYVGYMMGIPLNGTDSTTVTYTSANSTSYNEAHSNVYDSDAKKTIDLWYKANIEDKGLSKYVDENTGFCNDRELSKGIFEYTGDGYGTQNTAYAPVGRLYNGNSGWKATQTPTLQCINKNRDLFTHTSANEGNKKLTYPIGLITSDEVIFAGGFGGAQNSTYYLYTNQIYWTMSPYYYSAYSAAFQLLWGNRLGITSSPTYGGLRPVVNLRSDTKFTFNNETTKGSESDPFVVS